MGRREGTNASGDDASASDDARELKRSPTASRVSKPTRVYVGRVPSSLCLHEPGIRQLFEPFGTISAITVHHDALSMGADGYLFLEYTDANAAHAAVAAVTQADEAHDTTRFEGMCARIAVARGASAYCADPAVVDLLLGRRPTSGFSQQRHSSAFPMSQHDDVDEDELFLQSLSQRTTRRSSQSAATTTMSKKRKKRSIATLDEYDDDGL